VSVDLVNAGTGSSKPQTAIAGALSGQPTSSALPIELGIIAPGGKASFQLAFPDQPSGIIATLRVDVSNGPSIVKQYSRDLKMP
jgi:hypothetical protein